MRPRLRSRDVLAVQFEFQPTINNDMGYLFLEGIVVWLILNDTDLCMQMSHGLSKPVSS